VVSVKGFGDLVIALTCLARVRPECRHRINLLVGRHLQPLLAVLDAPFGSTVVDHPDAGPAALFQVRSRSPLAVLRSAVGVRRGLRRASAANGRVLVFDEMDIRHRFLASGKPVRSLPPSDNLYRSWALFLDGEKLTAPARAAVPVPHGRRLHIFPGAREAERRFSLDLLRALVSEARQAGLEPVVYTVDGELPELNDGSLPLEVMARDFGRTLAAVSAADRVISADSMTAHLAEHLHKPVYVLAPREKFFWLPLSAATAGRHALFGQPSAETTLPAFLRDA
jgi:hypothetical protein